jgi:hypothetical protein
MNNPITSGMKDFAPSKPIPAVTYVSSKQAGTWYTARELPPEEPDEKP